MDAFDTVVFKERFSYTFVSPNGVRLRKVFSEGKPFKLKVGPGINDYFCTLTSPSGATADGVSRARFDIINYGIKPQNSNEFQWIAFVQDKLVVFSNGELRAKRKMLKSERIRVLAKDVGRHFDITTAMDWKTTLLAEEFVFVVAPKPVIESFPEPFPGVQQSKDWSGSRWTTPKFYNGIPVVGGDRVSVAAKETRQPMIRLALKGGSDKKLFYEVASFAIE